VKLLAMLSLSLMGLAACHDSTAPAPGAESDGATPLAGDLVGRSGFGFDGSVGDPATGVVHLTGGGSFDQSTVAAGGGFRCTVTVTQGPLAGCEAGQGVRWDTAQLLASSPFKCTGTDAPRTATTDRHTAVLQADFYRAGDGNEESFTAPMFVADRDLAPDIPGVQNLWIQGVGCGTASVHFNN